jgi:hypothetical protein
LNGKISLKRKALGSFVGGILFTVFITWVLVGLILSLVGIRLGGLPIPFWFGNDEIGWLAFAFDVLFWSPIIGIADYCFIGKQGKKRTVTLEPLVSLGNNQE